LVTSLIDHVGEKFIGAPLGEQALTDLAAAARDRRDFDFRILFLEIRQVLFVATDVNRQLAFLLGRFESLLPLHLPPRLGLSGKGNAERS
jgi:hypothetical protein